MLLISTRTTAKKIVVVMMSKQRSITILIVLGHVKVVTRSPACSYASGKEASSSSYTTSAYHPLSELRSQTISPYSDFLLHDMGEGLADSLGEGEASGAEWRTSPLWGLGLSSCVTGGVEGPNQSQTCVEDASYLHDGRARTLEEAILWHGGEGAEARDAFQALSTPRRVRAVDGRRP